MTEYTPVEYTAQKYTVVCYYDKEMMPRKISRFADHSRAIKKIKQSLLTGQHADIIAQDIEVKEVKRIMADFRVGFDLPTFTQAIPGKPLVSLIVRPTSGPKFRIRKEIIEGVEYEIRKLKCTFLPGVK